jgi:hypothetical protein
VEQIRIVLVSMPRMLSDIIRELVDAEPALDIVAELDPHAPPAAIEAWSPDVVVAGRAASTRWGEELLFARPRRRVLAVDDDGRTGTLLELVPSRRELGELSRDTLIRALGAET